ncbi:MAG: hypothetical protein RIC56_13450 [Pseudomonadales bacterium]
MIQSVVEVGDQILDLPDVPYAQLCGAFSQASASLEPERLDVLVAGFRVRIRVIGRALAATILAPMAHLPAAAGGAPDLTIDVIHGEDTGYTPPETCLPTEGKYGILLKTSADGRFVGEERRHTRSWLDREQNRIVAWYQSEGLLNLDERARPFHKLLSTWLEERGVQFLHAGLITVDERGLLFVGNGGAGKSTSSIACMLSGMGYLGDDFVGFSGSSPHFQGHGIYGTCLLANHHIHRFPVLERISKPANHAFEDKRIMYLRGEYGGGLGTRIGLSALLLPRVVDRAATRTRAASKGEALMAIAPTSVMFLPRPSKAAFVRVSALVESLPTFWLELGRDVDAIPAAVSALARNL